MDNSQPDSRQLRVFFIEDNPLIVLHLEMLIEELGHVVAGFSESFMDLRRKIDECDFDLALVDIDLADGRTGGDAAAWLKARGCPSILITGQELIAATYSDVAVGVIIKPVTADLLAENLRAIE